MGKLDPPNLMAVGLHRIKTDERNYCVPVCFGHHMDLEAKRWYLRRHELPESVEEFAAEYGLGWYLDRTYGELERVA